jgi:F0F1-type ATP synthase assembly protein I
MWADERIVYLSVGLAYVAEIHEGFKWLWTMVLLVTTLSTVFAVLASVLLLGYVLHQQINLRSFGLVGF